MQNSMDTTEELIEESLSTIALGKVRKLKVIEKEEILKALAMHNNMTHAAKALGIGRSSLYRKLDKHKMVFKKII